MAQEDTAYAQAISEADLLLHDGIGLKVVSMIAGVPLQDNLNGTDFIPVNSRTGSSRRMQPFIFLEGTMVSPRRRHRIYKQQSRLFVLQVIAQVTLMTAMSKKC